MQQGNRNICLRKKLIWETIALPFYYSMSQLLSLSLSLSLSPYVIHCYFLSQAHSYYFFGLTLCAPVSLYSKHSQSFILYLCPSLSISLTFYHFLFLSIFFLIPHLSNSIFLSPFTSIYIVIIIFFLQFTFFISESFFSTCLPQANTRWVRSTFYPLSSKQRNWLNSATPTVHSLEKNSRTLGIEPGAAGYGSKCANNCSTLPPTPFLSQSFFDIFYLSSSHTSCPW